MINKKNRIIKSKNPHWCVSYLEGRKDDKNVEELVDVIMSGKSVLATISLHRLIRSDVRLHYIKKGDVLRKLRKMGLTGEALTRANLNAA